VNVAKSENNSLPGRPFSGLFQFLLICLPLLLFFGGLEIIARFYESAHPVLQVDIGQGFDESSLLFAPVPGGWMETRPEKTVSFKQQRFKMPKPPGVLRIFALGGSSVNYLDYEFSELEKELEHRFHASVDAVEVINCGGLSYGSHRLVLIAAEILHYQPDIVLLYSGHNEFEELQQLHLSLKNYGKVQQYLGKSAFYRLIREMRARKAIARLEESRQARDLAQSIPDSSKTWEMVFTQEEIDGRMEAYRQNLTMIIAQCREAEVPLIIGTVPSNLIRPNLPGKEGQLYEEVVQLYEAGDFDEAKRRGAEILAQASPRHQSSPVENGIIRDLARIYGVPLADVETAVASAEPHGIPGETLFSDHCHLNERGNRILRQQYQALIEDIVSRRYALEPSLGIQ